MLSTKHKFLFVHIPKTGGNSIQAVLHPYSEDLITSQLPSQDGVERFGVYNQQYGLKKHSTLQDYQNALGSDLFRRLFKFCCVRNPWDRAISAYFTPLRGRTTWCRETFLAALGRLKPAAEYLSLAGQGAVGSPFGNVDFVMRFERLDQDFQTVCRRIGLNCPALPVRNKSSRQHYSYYYDAELVEIIREKYREEIDYFGFEYEPTAKSGNPPGTQPRAGDGGAQAAMA